MAGTRVVRVVVGLCCAALTLAPLRLPAADLSAETVLNSIERAKGFLVRQQHSNGSWTARGEGNYQTGVTSLALLALINAGMTPEDEAVQNGLQYLRSEVREPQPKLVYETSLMIMALAAAGDGQRDKARILTLAQKLEDGQITQGPSAGTWSYYTTGRGGGDRSNGQFAILGLRDAAHAGIPVSRKTWRLAEKHWKRHQNADGGWGYSGQHNQNSTGSMTVAGIATLTITSSMLRGGDELNPDGTPKCCQDRQPDDSLQKGLRWMKRHFAVGHNPGSGGAWLLYYLYGMERAGRLSGRRFFGQHDWYREGAEFLVERQSQRDGSWRGGGRLEQDPVIGTSFALLFLSKGLSPVLINKLQYGPEENGNGNPAEKNPNWNKHRYDVRNLTNLVSGLEGWPRLVTWQVLDINKAVDRGGVRDLHQAPVVYMAGEDRPQLTDKQVKLLRTYVSQGGFLFAVANCPDKGDFDAGFRELVDRMYPEGEAELKPLPAGHPIYRSEYLLEPDAVDLHGVDFGCRTAIVYSPTDLSCLWDKWMRHEPPNRPAALTGMITKATRVGINTIAYATGRQPPKKLEQQVIPNEDGQQDQIERGFLQIAKLRHAGGWNAAPQALRNLLMALNRTVGMAASTKQPALPATDPDLFKYPMLYMHGRNHFQMGDAERKQLRTYLKRGGVLFADACCGSRAFDRSFREMIAEMFPEEEFERIPASHAMFTNKVGHDIQSVKRRTPAGGEGVDSTLKTIVREGEPFLEGIQLDGRYAVIYSKYDISCALQRQASVACAGYVAEDAVKLALNVVLYSLLQDVRYSGTMK